MMPRGRWWLLLLGLCVFLFAADALRYAGHQLDDTFISFRYARNLAEGNGLVFNPGERVEGYTNLLFVLLAAACFPLGLDPLLGTALVSVAAAAGVLALTVRLGRALGALAGGDRRPGEPDVAGAVGFRPGIGLGALVLLLTGEAFAYWSVIGLETVPFAALACAGLLLLIREGRAERGHASAWVFILLSMTRPEGAYVCGVALTAAAVLDRRRNGNWRHVGRLAVTAGIAGAGLMALSAWRLWYYGSLVPNTFHAKVTGGPGQLLTGLRYLLDWAVSSPLLAASLLAPLALLSGRVRARLGRGHPIWLVYSVVLSIVLYNVVVGGDSMPFFRFFAHVLPLLGLLAAFFAGASGLTGRLGPRAGALVAVLVVAIHAVAAHATVQPYRAFVAHRTAVVGSAVGKWFGRHLPAGALMAVNTVGALPYRSRLPTIDTLGLTDAAIARRPVYVSSTGWTGHRRGWGTYVMDRQPAAILWYNSAGSAEPFYLGDRELSEDPYFRFFYRHRVQRLAALGEAATGGGLQAAGDDEDRPIARFPGFPFGFHRSGSSIARELGVRARFHDGLIPHTTFHEYPILLRYFEPDPRDTDLWPLRAKHGTEVGRFVEEVAARWQAAGSGERPFDQEARAAVEALCAQAQKQVASGDLEAAKETLTRAAEINERARSPLVYRYMANVAVLTGDLLAAVPAQKEALRLAPGSALYRENLKRLLREPFESFGGKEGIR
jgi:hypothetical protein